MGNCDEKAHETKDSRGAAIGDRFVSGKRTAKKGQFARGNHPNSRKGKTHLKPPWPKGVSGNPGGLPGRPFSTNKLREKALHPLLVKLGIPRGGLDSMRHGATSALLADGANPAVVQKQQRPIDPRITLGIYGRVIGNQQRDAVEIRSARTGQLAVQ